MGEPDASGVELVAYHTASKGTSGECGLRGGCGAWPFAASGAWACFRWGHSIAWDIATLVRQTNHTRKSASAVNVGQSSASLCVSRIPLLPPRCFEMVNVLPATVEQLYKVR